MNLLIVGSGGNGEATAWAEYFARSSEIDNVYLLLMSPYESNCMNPKVKIVNGRDIKNLQIDYYWNMYIKQAGISEIRIEIPDTTIQLGTSPRLRELEVNKQFFKDECKRLGVQTPFILADGSCQELIIYLTNEHITYPIVIKPSSENIPAKTNIYTSKENAIKFLTGISNRCNNANFIVEEYISDTIHLEALYASDGNDIYSLGVTTEEKLWLGSLDTKGGWVNFSVSPCAKVTQKHKDFLADSTRKLLDGDIPKGLFCVQGLATVQDDEMFFIEINARPGGPDLVNMWNATEPFDFMHAIATSSFEKLNVELLDDRGFYYGIFTVINKAKQSILINTDKLVSDDYEVHIGSYNILNIGGKFFSASGLSPMVIGIVGKNYEDVMKKAGEKVPEIFNPIYFDFEF